MQIKASDDKTKHIEALSALLARPEVDFRTRERIELEIRTLRSGVRGERDAAYDIEFYYRDNKNVMTIHDLRIKIDGRVAQIDHLILDRFMQIWVCESKSFAEGVEINELGEWSAYYGRKAYGIPSPIEQNKRHIAVLNDVLTKRGIDLPKRLGHTLKPDLRGVVLLSKTARVTRPKGRAASQVEGLDTVVKVDQLKASIDRAFDQNSMIALAWRMVSTETVELLARQLTGLHSPASFDWPARFGLPPERPSTTPAPSTARTDPAVHEAGPTVRENKAAQAVCATCSDVVSAAVVTYCRDHASRFGGRVLCFACQRRSR